MKTAAKSNFLSQAEKKTIPQGSDDQVFFLYIGNLNVSIYRLYGGNTCILGGTGEGDLVVIPVAWGVRVDWWADGSKGVIPTASWRLKVGVFVVEGPWIGRYTCCLRKEMVCGVDSLRGWWKVVQRQHVKV